MNTLAFTDFAYIAGLFDGEGCIVIARKGKTSHKLYISCTNTYGPVLYWLQSCVGGVVQKREQRPGKWRKTYIWSMCNHQAAIFLEAILPHLRIKKHQAELAIEFDKLPKFLGHRHVPEEEQARREALRVEISRLNKGF